MKDIIHFSHANGFPASTYRTIFAELADDYEIRSVERFGHDPRYPVTRDWPHLVDQLLDDIASRRTATRQTQPKVWLVGHSLGGYLSLMAALKRPQWVKGVVMLDSPVIGGLAQQSLARVAMDGARRAPVARRRDQETPHAVGEPRRSVAALSLEARVRALGRAHAVRLHRLRDSADGRERRALARVRPARRISRSTGRCRTRSARGSRAASQVPVGLHRGDAIEGSAASGTRTHAAHRGRAFRVDRGQPSVPDGAPDRHRARSAANA